MGGRLSGGRHRGVWLSNRAQADTPGRSDWIKVKNRESRQVIVGAAPGAIPSPTAVIAGLFRAGELVVAGRTSVLTDPSRASWLACSSLPETITRGRIRSAAACSANANASRSPECSLCSCSRSPPTPSPPPDAIGTHFAIRLCADLDPADVGSDPLREVVVR
jgi:hypothetical protein